MYKVDYKKTYEELNNLSKYSLNVIESHIRKNEKSSAEKAIQSYKNLRDSLVDFNFYSKEFDDKLNRLEIMAEELPEEDFNGSEIRKSYD